MEPKSDNKSIKIKEEIRKRKRTGLDTITNSGTEVARNDFQTFEFGDAFPEQINTETGRVTSIIQGSIHQPGLSSPADTGDVLNLLSDSIIALQDDNSTNHSHICEAKNKIEALEEKVKILTDSLRDAISTIDSQRHENEILKEKIAQIEERMPTSSDVLCSDGTFIWKITGIRRKIEEAIKQEQSSIYSPSYCLSTYGYRVRLRLFLNGDGQARNKSVSLFFVIMRGEYDNLIPWPFNRKVTFCLHDQTASNLHIIRSFIPDPKSKSFARPTTDMNFSSGIPDFCSVQTIHQDNNNYVRDDSMYIRCLVDFGGSKSKSVRERCQVDLSIPVLLQGFNQDNPAPNQNNSAPNLDHLAFNQDISVASINTVIEEFPSKN